MDSKTLHRIQKEAAEHPRSESVKTSVKTFVGNTDFVLTPADPLITFIWSIQNPHRQFYLKSVIWAVYIYNATNVMRVPWYINTMVTCNVSVSQAAGVYFMIGYDFTPFAGPPGFPVPSLVNRQIYLNDPGRQYYFDDLLFNNDLLAGHLFESHDPVNTYMLNYNLVIEILE